MTRPQALALALLAFGSLASGQPAPESIASIGEAGASLDLLVRGTTDVAQLVPVLEAFVEARPEVHVIFEAWNTNDLYQTAVAACHGEAPVADLLMSSSVDQQVKLVNDGCAQPYRSPATAALPASANWRDEIFGVTSEPAVIVYNRALLAPEDAPGSRFDLLDLLRREGGRLEGKVATYDIEASGVGYLFAFLDSQEATTFGSLIGAFAQTGTVATCCTAEIVDGVASGRYLLAYNLLGSYALARAAENPDLAVVLPSDYTLVLSRAVMVPKDAPNPVPAGLLIDFLLSERGRRAMEATHMTVTPEVLADSEATLRPIPLSPVLLVGLDSQKRAQFLNLWRSTFPPP